MKLSQSLTLDLDYVLRMLEIKRKQTALIVGFIPRWNDGSGLYDNKDVEIDNAVAGLLDAGINTYLFLHWSYFNEIFIRSLRFQAGTERKIRTVLVSGRFSARNESDPNGFFDNIIWTDDCLCDEDDVPETLLYHSGTLACYDKERMQFTKTLIGLATKQKIKIIQFGISGNESRRRQVNSKIL